MNQTADKAKQKLTVWKYHFGLKEYEELEMPAGATILKVATQGIPTLWALVDPAAQVEKRTLLIAGTGSAITESKSRLIYLDTIFNVDKTLVFHVFEIVAEVE